MMTARPAFSILFSTGVTLAEHYWVTSRERQRMSLFVSRDHTAVRAAQVMERIATVHQVPVASGGSSPRHRAPEVI
jgi:hypothetical protein